MMQSARKHGALAVAHRKVVLLASMLTVHTLGTQQVHDLALLMGLHA